MNKNYKCLFCKKDCLRTDSQVVGEFFFNCENNCGRYFTEEKLEQKISNLNKKELEKMSNYLKNRGKNNFHELITEELIKKIIK